MPVQRHTTQDDKHKLVAPFCHRHLHMRAAPPCLAGSLQPPPGSCHFVTTSKPPQDARDVWQLVGSSLLQETRVCLSIPVTQRTTTRPEVHNCTIRLSAGSEDLRKGTSAAWCFSVLFLRKEQEMDDRESLRRRARGTTYVKEKQVLGNPNVTNLLPLDLRAGGGGSLLEPLLPAEDADLANEHASDASSSYYKGHRGASEPGTASQDWEGWGTLVSTCFNTIWSKLARLSFYGW
jgi:hypothetical protein